jgi:hypothetical protein
MPTVDDDKKVVSGTNANSSASTSTTLADFEHPGGMLLVFHTAGTGSASSAITVSLAFDGVSATKLNTAFQSEAASGVQVDAFAITASAKTADIVATLGSSLGGRSLFALPIVGDAEVRTTVTSTTGVNNSVALSSSVTADTVSGDLVLQCARWRNSATNVASYASDQTQVLSDDTPTRCDTSEKSATSASTTLTTTLSAASTSNVMCSVAVILNDSASVDLHVTNLKEPNQPNQNITSATGVTVQLWKGASVDSSPDAVLTGQEITAGELELTITGSDLEIDDAVTGTAFWDGAEDEVKFIVFDAVVLDPEA